MSKLDDTPPPDDDARADGAGREPSENAPADGPATEEPSTVPDKTAEEPTNGEPEPAPVPDDAPPLMPPPLKITRALMWTQAVVAGVWAVLQVNIILQLQGLSDAEIREQFGDTGIEGQADLPYGSFWTQIVLLAAFALALGWSAWKFATRKRSVRIVAIATEFPIIALGLLNFAALNCIVMLGVIGIGVMVMLWRRDGREWFEDAPPPRTP